MNRPLWGAPMVWTRSQGVLINCVCVVSGSVALGLIGSVVTTPITAAPAPLLRPIPCPQAATQQLDGFYSWFLTSPDMRAQFTSQKQRFTPELEELLLAAFALQPSDGRFVDFDPFSNTQVRSYSHRIACCWQEPGDLLVMRVLVQAGLSRDRANEQTLDYVLSRDGSSWHIADIRYPGEVSFSLRMYLKQLLRP